MRRAGRRCDGHHGYAGGLLEHTVGVATLCRETAQLHPRLTATCSLAAAARTTSAGSRALEPGQHSSADPEEGALLGHVQLGVRLVDEAARRPRRGALPSS